MSKIASKVFPKDQRSRFIDAAREAGCSEDEAVFDANLKRIGEVKPPKDEPKE